MTACRSPLPRLDAERAVVRLAGLDSVLALAGGARWSPIPRHSLVAAGGGAQERGPRHAPDSRGLRTVAGGHDQPDSVLAVRAEPDRAAAAPAGAAAPGAIPAVAQETPAGGVRLAGVEQRAYRAPAADAQLEARHGRVVAQRLEGAVDQVGPALVRVRGLGPVPGALAGLPADHLVEREPQDQLGSAARDRRVALQLDLTPGGEAARRANSGRLGVVVRVAPAPRLKRDDRLSPGPVGDPAQARRVVAHALRHDRLVARLLVDGIGVGAERGVDVGQEVDALLAPEAEATAHDQALVVGIQRLQLLGEGGHLGVIVRVRLVGDVVAPGRGLGAQHADHVGEHLILVAAVAALGEPGQRVEQAGATRAALQRPDHLHPR